MMSAKNADRRKIFRGELSSETMSETVRPQHRERVKGLYMKTTEEVKAEESEKSKEKKDYRVGRNRVKKK